MGDKKSPLEEVLEAVEVDPLALDEEFKTIASRIATFNERYSRALRRHLLAKIEVDRAYAATYLTLREEANEAGDKVTEALLKSQVEQDPRYIKARTDGVEAEVEKVRLYGVLESLRAKKDAIISLGANMRAELGGDPSLRGERRGARDVQRNHQDDEEFNVDLD